MKKPPRMTERQKLTVDVMAEELRKKVYVPPGAFTKRDLMAKSGASEPSAQDYLAEKTKAGKLIRGGPRGCYYWPA